MYFRSGSKKLRQGHEHAYMWRLFHSTTHPGEAFIRERRLLEGGIYWNKYGMLNTWREQIIFIEPDQVTEQPRIIGVARSC